MKTRFLSLFFSTLLMLCGANSLMAQDPSQMQMIEGMSATEIAELQKMQMQDNTASSSEGIIDDKNDRLRQYDSTLTTSGQISTDTPPSTVFGNEMFSVENLTFAPSLSIPTPRNYIISTGDELIIVLWGVTEAEYQLTVTAEGDVIIPSIGVIHVAGLTIEAAEKRLRQKFMSAVEGLAQGTVQIKITLGDIRSITVNIVGEARVPGTYTLPSLASVFNALYVAGGVNSIGSLRDIKLYRAGKLVSTLDVYDYLLNGASEVDQRLEDNDLIVISPYSDIVEITGNVRRPKTYELKRDERLTDLIELAGGFAGDAYQKYINITRKGGGKQLTMHTVAQEDFETFALMDKDVVTVGEVVDKFSNRATIEGAVWRPGNYEISDKMATVGDLVNVAEGLSEDAFGGRAMLLRRRADMSLETIPVNIAKILMGTAPDVPLQKEDVLTVTSYDDMREGQTISVRGEVNDPHIIPYSDGVTLEDVIVMAKGLKNSASMARIEVARVYSNAKDTIAPERRAEVFSFPVPEDLTLEGKAADFTLAPYDIVFVRRTPGYTRPRIVTVTGEVNFSGEYAMETTIDKLSDLITAAGGLTAQAYAKGASLQRKFTAEDSVKNSALMSLEIAENVAASRAVEDETIEVYEKQLELEGGRKLKVGDLYMVGIDLVAAMNDPNGVANLTLKEGDMLLIPTYTNTITISGAVYYPTTLTYDPKLTVREYIERAGGYSEDARRKPFIVEMNGTVLSVRPGQKVPPGSQIVIPSKPYTKPIDAQGWVGISASLVSMAAMVVSLLL